MTWTIRWENNAELYMKAKTWLDNASPEILAEIYSEWFAKGEDPDDMDELKDEVLKKLHQDDMYHSYRDTVKDQIFSYAKLNAEVSNGGHDIYMCPYGCQTHSVELYHRLEITIATFYTAVATGIKYYVGYLDGKFFKVFRTEGVFNSWENEYFLNEMREDAFKVLEDSDDVKSFLYYKDFKDHDELCKYINASRNGEQNA